MNDMEGESTVFDKNAMLADTPEGSDTSEDPQKMEDGDYGGGSQVLCSKRMLSTEDPDYARPPDAKRMREMEKKAQDELSGRVIKIVDREFTYSINEKQSELEEIDNRILRLQQCLHTLRYCVSLNYFAANKSAEVISTPKNLEIHPSVRRHLGKTPRSHSSQEANGGFLSKSFSAGQSVSEEGSADFSLSGTISDSVKKELNIQSNERGMESCRDHLMVRVKTEVHADSKSQVQKEGRSESAKNDDPVSSRPPSPKYLPPKPPDNPQTIAQGRHQRFQAKKRVVVGNTYQYLPPHASNEAGDALRYKWQVYVRAPTQADDVSSFISAVTFILDQSYAPHHIITLKHPPFVLSRRGWGEFKIQIVLKFADSRNKQVKLLHPLTLSRADDPLALTGLWRLGQENWYDIWVYDQDKNAVQTKMEPSVGVSEEEENCPANLEKELAVGVVSHKVEENITVMHSTKAGSDAKTEDVLQETVDKIEGLNKVTCTSSASGKNILTHLNADHAKNPQTSSAMHLPRKSEIVEPLQSKECASVAKGSNVNGAQGKVCKIHVRQPDGRLVPYFIPAHMYSLALKIAQTGNKIQGSQEGSMDNKQVSPVEKTGLQQEPKGSQQSASSNPESEYLVKVQKESKDITQQKKSVEGETKCENGQESSKGSGVPVKIFNISPNKGSVKPSQVVMGQLPSSGSQSIPKLTLTTQGKQTVARVSAGSLSQNALQQLLVKAGLKDKKPALVKKLLSKTNDVNGELVQSIQSPEGQLLSDQSSLIKKPNLQFMPVKIVQDKQPGGSSTAKIVKKAISTANIRFVTNNGQLISAGQLAKGLTIPVASKPSTVTQELPTSKCILATSSTSTTAAIKDGASVVVMPSGRILAGSGGLQLVTSQGKNTVTQHPPLVVCSSAQSGKTLQLPPLIVRSAGNNRTLCTLSNTASTGSTGKNIAVTGVSLLRGNIVTSVTPATVRTLLKPLCITTTAGVTATTPVFTNVSTKVTSIPTTLKSSSAKTSGKIIGPPVIGLPDKVAENSSEDQEVSATKKWEDQIRQLKATCQACRSLDACINLWVRAIPLVAPPNKWINKCILPFCAGSIEEFKLWPLGKQRAAEFQRAREVRKYLSECGIEGSNWWTTNRIVAWARCQAYTPVEPRPLLQTDKLFLPLEQQVFSTITDIGNLEEQEGSNSEQQFGCSAHQDIDVVSVTAEEEELRSPHKSSASPRKEQSVFMAWEDQETVDGCEWVGHLASQLRINQTSEEVAPGYRADVARATMWKAMLNLMEDLLRSSHSEAWGDSSEETSDSPPLVPPKEITHNHVLKALTRKRQEFQLFTNYGLGSLS
ncbi:YEATS domain-containing protein 2-like [Penaeus monodon]|uniref:YEATS domain-containing protein 2-like n=1 Tax=Penaeus monodon TaxID=6687 RepID=UPI0018A7BBE7|nr:YEATS domain-containing protein 2-like [Penaeus monodon]